MSHTFAYFVLLFTALAYPLCFFERVSCTRLRNRFDIWFPLLEGNVKIFASLQESSYVPFQISQKLVSSRLLNTEPNLLSFYPVFLLLLLRTWLFLHCMYLCMKNCKIERNEYIKAMVIINTIANIYIKTVSLITL